MRCHILNILVRKQMRVLNYQQTKVQITNYTIIGTIKY